MSDPRAAVDRSFEELYRGHRADVFRAVLRRLGNVHDAEDITQAAFVDAYRAVLRGSRPEAPRAWLLAIAENVRRRRFRTAQRRPREEPLDADFPLTAEVPFALAQTLAEALAELPEEQRQVFVLRELGGLSYEEIADETGATVGAVQMQLFRARRSLRRRLEPPSVGRRRVGLVLPVPGWLAGLWSRAELATLTPRAAGAVGAAVAAAAATVAVGEVQADAPAQRAVEPRPALVAPAPVSSAVRVRPAVRREVRSTPSRSERPVATPGLRADAQVKMPLAVPDAAAPPPAREPAVASAELAAATEPIALEPSRLPLRLVENTVAAVLEQAASPPHTAVAAAAGAAGAAGADAPPLPVPDVPPVALPPAP